VKPNCPKASASPRKGRRSSGGRAGPGAEAVMAASRRFRAHGHRPKKPAGKFAIPMVRANRPALALGSWGLPETACSRCRPSHAGVADGQRDLRQDQHDEGRPEIARVGAMMRTSVGPNEKCSRSKPPRVRPAAMPAATAVRAAAVSCCRATPGPARTRSPDDQVGAVFGQTARSPDMNSRGSTISSTPFFRKTRPRDSWMPRTTGWVNSLAAGPPCRKARTRAAAPEDHAGSADDGLRNLRRIGDAMAPTALRG